MKREVLGVKIDDIALREAVKKVMGFAKGGPAPRLVFTTGPEFVVTAQKDPEFKKILNSADLNIPDGVGLKLFCGFENVCAGVDLMLELCRLAAEKNLTVGLFGGGEGVAKKAKAVLEEKYPGIRIKFAIDGGEADKIISNLQSSIFKTVDLLFAGLGHPKQEKFLSQIRSLKSDFRVGMGVGGSFDFLAGVLPRPPLLIRKLGLGWLWRGFTKPGHWQRIWTAVVVFPALVLKEKLELIHI
jgi:N-acetylglucosaminyldiphosphoundecaprenol N-acetyl-beta-D-mannosaminyltransferase